MLSKPKSEKDIKIGGKSNKTTLVGALMILLAFSVYISMKSSNLKIRNLSSNVLRS